MGVVDCASKYKGFISGSGTEERRAAEVLGATRGTRRQRSRAGNIFSAMCCFKSMLVILKLLLKFTFWFTKHGRVQQSFVRRHRKTQFAVFEIQNPQLEFHVGCSRNLNEISFFCSSFFSPPCPCPCFYFYFLSTSASLIPLQSCFPSSPLSSFCQTCIKIMWAQVMARWWWSLGDEVPYGEYWWGSCGDH